MIFKRKIYQKLLDWKNETKGSKALLIEGARRIGKSTIAEEFAKNEYKTYILIDFSTATDTIKSYFVNYINDLDTFFLMISTAYKVSLYERETLFIFDEVQFFPIARQSIKHLVSDGRYDYLETGSLISLRENVKNILIPSEERRIKMYPMDFEEFLWAMGEHLLWNYIKKCYDMRTPLETGLHNQAMLNFKKYILVGGMPKVVSVFLLNRQRFEEADREKRDILSLYRNDIMKIRESYRVRTALIFDQIPGFLSKHEKRVIYNQVESGSSADDFFESFFWLQDSMICNECFNCSDPNVGLAINEERTFVKCYMGDTGLLISHAFTENELLEESVYQQILNDKLSFNEGMLYENVIAQILTANNHQLFFYNHYNPEKGRNDIEIDFLISNNSRLKYKVYPIEVKSTKRFSTVSLTRFTEKFKQRIGESIVLYPGNLKSSDNITFLPCYMAGFL